jgi:two-component system, chemotaxis family, protein-glutamate methylesterase/glutaminase
MKEIKLIAIGGSAGSLQIIFDLLDVIPPDFPIPILVILHRNGLESGLETLFSSRTKLRCKEVEEKESITARTLYICPPDYHVLIEQDHSFSLDYSERVQFCRPSIDVTFASAADVYAAGLLALLLSGANSDGTEGLIQVKERGGVTLVQDPATAEVAFMPAHAIDKMTPNLVIRASEMPAFIVNLAD